MIVLVNILCPMATRTWLLRCRTSFGTAHCITHYIICGYKVRKQPLQHAVLLCGHLAHPDHLLRSVDPATEGATLVLLFSYLGLLVILHVPRRFIFLLSIFWRPNCNCSLFRRGLMIRWPFLNDACAHTPNTKVISFLVIVFYDEVRNGHC